MCTHLEVYFCFALLKSFSDLVRSIKCYFVLSILKPSNVPRFFEFGIPIRAEIGLML